MNVSEIHECNLYEPPKTCKIPHDLSVLISPVKVTITSYRGKLVSFLFAISCRESWPGPAIPTESSERNSEPHSSLSDENASKSDTSGRLWNAKGRLWKAFLLNGAGGNYLPRSSVPNYVLILQGTRSEHGVIACSQTLFLRISSVELSCVTLEQCYDITASWHQIEIRPSPG